MSELETRFVRPPQPLLDHLAAGALAAAGEPRSPSECTWVEHGSNTVVVLGGRTAVRIARSPAGAAGLRRAQALVDALPELPFAVPRSVGEPVQADGHLAIPTLRLRGASSPGQPVDAVVLADLLEAVHAVHLDLVRDHLAPARAFTGGADWERVLTEQVVPLLALERREEAHRRIRELATLEAVPPAFNHGDLGSSNVLWADGRVVGVLDWDLAAADDPAEDVATVATSFGAWEPLAALLGRDTMRRARTFADTFGLQVVAFAVLGGRPPEEVARAVARAEHGLRAP